jgi:capsular polysaccharide biosynthesis protein
MLCYLIYGVYYLMKAFFFFAPHFLDWPLAVARELYEQSSGHSVMGVITGTKDLYNYAFEHRDPPIEPLYWLEELEREWLQSDIDEDLLNKYDRDYEPGFLQKILFSDRKLGAGYVSGGLMPPCPLIDISADHEKVKRYICGLLKFIEKLVLTDKPDIALCYCVAGSFALALAEICRHNSVAFCQITHSRINSISVVDTDSKMGLQPVIDLFKRSLDNPELVADSIPAAEQYLKEYREKPLQPDYASFNRKAEKKLISWSGILKQLMRDMYGVASVTIKGRQSDLRKAGEWSLARYNFRLGLRRRSIMRNFKFDKSESIPQRPFVYYPLHVNPEASTMVLAPMHDNQLHIIESIAKSIPLTWNVLVKEHRPMIGLRPDGFYERLQKLPGVYLLSPYENNFDLIQRSQVVCTITGTAAWESLMLHIPVIIMGQSQYIALKDGLIYCPDLTQMPSAIRQSQEMPAIDNQLLIRYIAAIFELGFDFPTDIYWGKVTKETIENNRKIAQDICERLISLHKMTRTNQG